MDRPWLKFVVVVFWVSTMTWLVVEKVLPPLSRGEPPSVHSIYGGLDPDAPPICWSVSYGNKPVGWAIIRAVRPASGMLEIYSRVHLTRLPVKEMAAAWKQSLLEAAVEKLSDLGMDAFNRVEIDPLHRLTGFRSSIRLTHIPQAIAIEGTLEGSRLRIHVDLAGMVPLDPPDQFLSPDALVVDELSPQARLPGLHVGQTWTEPVYNPMLPGGQLEMLQATVEESELRSWNGKAVEALRVVYRGDPGALSDAAAPRGKMWVARDGTVLRQELSLLGSRLIFDRLPTDDGASLPPGLAEALRQGNYGSRSFDVPRRAPRAEAH
jgi:hypothetical protein